MVPEPCASACTTVHWHLKPMHLGLRQDPESLQRMVGGTGQIDVEAHASQRLRRQKMICL